MANVVDSFVIELGLDPRSFTEGQRAALDAFKKTQEAAVQGGKNIEAQGKKAAEYLSNLKREALTLLAVVAGGKGVVDMVQHITSLDASTARLARTFNISTEALAKWQIMFREVGGSVESARSVIGGISAAVQTAQITQQWDPNMVALFSRMGLPREDWGNPDAVLNRLQEFGQSPEMKGHPERFAAWARFMPGMNQDAINLFTDPEFQEIKSGAEALAPKGGGIGPESARFQRSMVLFSTAVDNFVRPILDTFVPAMDKLRELFGVIYNPTGENAAKLHDEASKKSFAGVAQGFANWVDYGLWGLPTPDRDAAGPKSSAKPATAAAGGRRGSNAFAPGETITGIQIYSDTVGARGAASTSTTNNRSSRSTSKTDVTIHNINLPGVKDAQQFVGSLDDVLSLQSHGAALNGGPR